MRPILALLAVMALAAADDPIAGLRFSDGVERSAADFAGQNVLLYYYCGG